MHITEIQRSSKLPFQEMIAQNHMEAKISMRDDLHVEDLPYDDTTFLNDKGTRWPRRY